MASPDIILVHNPKCAGSSMKFLLAAHCPERWLNPPHNLQFPPDLAKHHGIDLERWRASRRNRQDDYQYYAGRMDFAFGGQHRNPERVMNQFPDAFRIGQVRHPYDKVLSAIYQWGALTPDQRALTGRTHLEPALLMQLGHDLIDSMPDDLYFLARVPMDNIVRFEHLEEDWARIAPQIDLPTDLPVVNRKYPKRPFELLPDHKKKILKKWAWTFAQFGYDTMK